MRTKTLALSAVLGALGTASMVAQTNVYSLNAVGYINVTMPPGYSIVTCPLICSPDNSLNTLFPNGNGTSTPPSGIPYAGATVLSFSGGAFTGTDSGNGVYAYGGWANGGTLAVNPGSAIFFQNPDSTNMTATFVGQVPTGTLTNTLVAGYNLVGSMVPVSGDLSTNSIANLNVTPGFFDYILFFDTVAQQFASSVPTEGGMYSPGWAPHPVTTSVTEGFFYYNAQGTGHENWVETFSINP